jgi:hypothetical protein
MMQTPKLRKVIRLDSIKLDDTYFTQEGYLRDNPIVTSVGIFEYTNPDGTVRRELRLPDHVFAKKSLESYKGKPVIITHDAGVVDKKNVDQEHIGTILSEGYQDGPNVRAEIVIHDTDAMKECGLKELSLGYSLDLDETPGVWEGQPYDAIQTNILINHLALVSEARAGEQARLNIDGKSNLTRRKKAMRKKTRKDGGPMTPEELVQAVEAYKDRRDKRIGGDNAGEEVPPAKDQEETKPVPVTDTEGGDVDKVQMVKDRRDRRDQEGDPETPEAALGVIAQQDEDIDTLLSVIEAMEAKSDFDSAEEEKSDSEEEEEENKDEEEDKKDGDEGEAKSLNADSIDRIVRTRVALARIGDRLNLDGLDSMSIMDAKKAIIRKVKPQMRLDGKGKTYINAAFDLAISEMNTKKDTNFQRGQMFNADSGSRAQAGKTSADKAREKMIFKRNGGN